MAWGDVLERVVTVVATGAATLGLKHVYDGLMRRRGRNILVLELRAPPVPKRDMWGITPSYVNDVVLNVTNASSKPVRLIWGGVAWTKAIPGLPIDEDSADLRHASPQGVPGGHILLPNRSFEFAVTSTDRLNPTLAWVGVEVVLDDGEHQTFKVPARQLSRLIRDYERYRRRVAALLTGGGD